MHPLFADTDLVEASGFFPDYFGVMLLALVLIFALTMVLFTVGFKIIDWITPGKLNDEIVPRDPSRQPNMALAIVVGAMIIGVSIVLGCAVIAVLVH